MRVRVLAVLALALGLLNACATWQKKPSVVPASLAINAVKDELMFTAMHLPALERKVPAGTLCHSAANTTLVKLTPKGVKVTLKIVDGVEKDPSVGLVNALGALSIDPSFSGSYSKSHTQNLEIDLGFPSIAGSPTPATAAELAAHPVAANIIYGINELFNVDHNKAPCLTPSALQASTSFDVQNKSTTGFNLNLWIFKFGDKVVLNDEAHNSMEIDYDLTGSGPLVPN